MMTMTQTAHLIARPLEAVELKERRREPRLAVHAPVFVRSLIEEPGRPLHEGRTTDLNLRGVSLTVPQWKPLAQDDILLLSIPIPPAYRSRFPQPRLAGCGRIVWMLQELPPDGSSETMRLRLAVEFADI